MDVRPAGPADSEQIRAIARDSLHASYSLSPDQIETILEVAFSDPSLQDLLTDDDTAVFVVNETVDGREQLFGFITVEMGAHALIRWLHVDPAARGGGLATAMIQRVRDEAGERPIGACILDDAIEGGGFLEAFGLQQAGHDELTIGSEEFDVTLFTEGEHTASPTEPTVPVPGSVTVDGDERPVDSEESVPGRDAPFVTIQCADDDDAAFGYFCSECGGTNVSIDGLDRLECGDCGNAHLADEWDDAYL